MRNKLPPLNALRSFEAAARHESFRDAANELCVSHSAISHQIKALEGHLGTKLFVREARAVSLTKVGRNYYSSLRGAFDQIAEATQIAMTPHGPKVLTVQLYSTFAIRWLIPRLPDFQSSNPEIQVRLQTSQADVDFAHEDVDACIMIGERTDDSLVYDFLFSTEMFPVASPRLRLSNKSLNQPEDLANHTMLQVYPSARDWHDWLSANDLANQLSPDHGLQFDSYELALSTAAQGQGVAIGMLPYVAKDLQAGVLVDLFPDRHVQAHGNWWLVYRREKSDLSRIQRFRDWLTAQIEADKDIPRANYS